MMKKLLSLFCAYVLIVVLVACGSDDSSISLPPGADVSVAVSSSEAAPASSANEAGSESSTAATSITPPASSVSEEAVESSVSGTVNDVAMGKLYVDLEDGRTVTFDYTTADISKWEDTMPGAKVTVYYYGTLDGNETAGIAATRIVTPS